MGLFDEILSDNESIFLNDVALSYEFIPKLVPYREAQQKRVAASIAPLFQERSGRNIIVHGPPGVGKTVATRHVLNELEEKTDEIIPLYINCWQKNTSFKTVMAMCELIGYKFTHNKKTDELFDIVAKQLNKYSTVFVFDEIDKAEDLDFIYMILQKIHKKAIVLLTNYKDVVVNMDMRIRSRLVPEMMEFKPYNLEETRGILKQRTELAFVKDVWEQAAFEKIVAKTFELQDIRTGLYLIKEAGQLAQEASQRHVTMKYVEQALQKLEDFKIKSTDDLNQNSQEILKVIKEYKTPVKIGDVYKKYDSLFPGKVSYKTFTRRIAKLEEGKFIIVKKTEGGPQGNTTFISYNTQTKTLDDF